MDELLLRAYFGDDHEIWLSEISSTTYRANDPEDLGTECGYFLMMGSRKPGGSGARIIAKAASLHAALELYGLLTSRSVIAATSNTAAAVHRECTITGFRSSQDAALNELRAQ